MTDGSSVALATAGARSSGRNHPSIDVICAGMYRACSTWQYEVVAHLLERHHQGRRLGYLTAEQYAGLARSDTSHGTTETANSWRAFKSHEGDRRFARALARGRARAVYAYRDVRDVVFSLMHKRGRTFDQLLRQGMIHQILANDRFWVHQRNVLIQRYEDLLADPLNAVHALARHLGIRLDEDEAGQIVHAYSLESNQARTAALRRRLEQAGLDLSEAANSQICDSATLLHWNHVRSGGSGSWSTQATPRQRAILDRLCRRWLERRNYPTGPVGDELDPAVVWQPGLAESLRIELDLAVGRMAYLVRVGSQRFPQLVHLVKRLVGIPDGQAVGATVWSDSRAGGEADRDRPGNEAPSGAPGS